MSSKIGWFSVLGAGSLDISTTETAASSIRGSQPTTLAGARSFSRRASNHIARLRDAGIMYFGSFRKRGASHANSKDNGQS